MRDEIIFIKVNGDSCENCWFEGINSDICDDCCLGYHYELYEQKGENDES